MAARGSFRRVPEAAVHGAVQQTDPVTDPSRVVRASSSLWWSALRWVSRPGICRPTCQALEHLGQLWGRLGRLRLHGHCRSSVCRRAGPQHSASPPSSVHWPGTTCRRASSMTSRVPRRPWRSGCSPRSWAVRSSGSRAAGGARPSAARSRAVGGVLGWLAAERGTAVADLAGRSSRWRCSVARFLAEGIYFLWQVDNKHASGLVEVVLAILAPMMLARTNRDRLSGLLLVLPLGLLGMASTACSTHCWPPRPGGAPPARSWRGVWRRGRARRPGLPR